MLYLDVCRVSSTHRHSLYASVSARVCVRDVQKSIELDIIVNILVTNNWPMFD